MFMSEETVASSNGRTFFSKFLVIFLVFIMIISAFVFLYMRYTQRSIARDLASDVIIEINNGIIEKTTHFLMPAVIVAETGRLLSASNALDLSDQFQLEHYSETVLKPYPQFAAFYYGDKHGNFVMTQRVEHGFYTKIIKAKAGQTIFKDKNRSGRIIARSSVEKVDYDPRERPWYIGAKDKGERFWTDIYIFFTGKQPGITASYPVYDSNSHFLGSFGVDIQLSEVSNFLNVNRIGKEGIVFIVNDKNKLIAFPKGKSDFGKSSGEVVHLVSLNSSRIKKAMSKYRGKESGTFLFEDKGISYIGAVSHFPDSFDKEWRIVLIAPLSYFVDITSNPLIEYLGLLILLILGYTFAKWATALVEKPFSRALVLVKQFRVKDYKGRVKKTHILEADELIDNLNAFAESLDSNS